MEGINIFQEEMALKLQSENVHMLKMRKKIGVYRGGRCPSKEKIKSLNMNGA